jgi:hypothetical protein
MTDTLLVEGIPVSTEPPAPEPQTQTSGPQEPPQAPPEAPPGDGGGNEPQQPQPILETAFVVYMNPQGHWMVASDIHTAAEMQIARPPNVDDFFYGCSTVLRDIQVQETAATAVAMQQQALTQMAENARQAQATAQIQQALGGSGAGGIDLSTLGRGRP